jgi:hypothetical protein
MGGPTRESYKAAAEVRAKRRAALRSRPGVVDLCEWRSARDALRALDRFVTWSDWVLSTSVVPGADGTLELRVTLLRDSREVRMCLPSAVNEVPVQVVVRNPANPPEVA